MLGHVPPIDLSRIATYSHDLADALSRVMGRYTSAEVAAMLNQSACGCCGWIEPERQRAILACATQPRSGGVVWTTARSGGSACACTTACRRSCPGTWPVT